MIVKAQRLPASIAALLDAAALRHSVPATLVRAVAWIESRGDAKAVSPAGARGIMQLMPKTAESLGVKDSFNPAENIEGGVRYLASMLRKYGGNEELALMAYNWGPGKLDREMAQITPPPAIPESVQQYARNVLARKVEEGNRESGSPFSWAPSQSGLRCPHCSHAITIALELELL